MTARLRRFLTCSALLDVPQRRHVMHESKTKSPKFLFCHTHVRICLLHTSRSCNTYTQRTKSTQVLSIITHNFPGRILAWLSLLNWGGKGPLARNTTMQGRTLSPAKITSTYDHCTVCIVYRFYLCLHRPATGQYLHLNAYCHHPHFYRHFAAIGQYYCSYFLITCAFNNMCF
jgi:hypothetical protein